MRAVQKPNRVRGRAGFIALRNAPHIGKQLHAKGMARGLVHAAGLAERLEEFGKLQLSELLLPAR